MDYISILDAAREVANATDPWQMAARGLELAAVVGWRGLVWDDAFATALEWRCQNPSRFATAVSRLSLAFYRAGRWSAVSPAVARYVRHWSRKLVRWCEC